LVSVIRKDYLLDRWVIIAAARALRPSDFAAPHRARVPATCPFCPGNEHLTPRAVLIYLPDGRGRISKTRDTRRHRVEGWVIRCIPNLYPALSPRATSVERYVRGLRESRPAKGYHEILIESPSHNWHPGIARLGQLKLVLHGYLDRLRVLSRKPSIKYVSIFRNHGQEGGASLSHAHTQIIATTMVPKTVKDELYHSMAFLDERNACAYCRVVALERKSPRFLYEDEDFLTIAPWASTYPFEFWIIPKRHSPSLLDATANEIERLATAMRVGLGALSEALRDPPYNYGFHIAPTIGKHDHYHWHLEVYPRLSKLAGFELSTGFYINTLLPERAGKLLKKTIADQIRKLKH
jgi:UDPglucose--hexose-1-phosphate uridylyltransferase